jgi:hypothetical protein
MLFARRFEHALDVTVQGAHHANPRKHRRPAGRRDHDQGFHRRLPFRRFVLGFGQRRDVGPGIPERDELAATGQRDRIIECPFPSAIRHQPANRAACARRDRSSDISPRSNRADLATLENRLPSGSTGIRARRRERPSAPPRGSPRCQSYVPQAEIPDKTRIHCHCGVALGLPTQRMIVPA